jgi:hypothetical protein
LSIAGKGVRRRLQLPPLSFQPRQRLALKINTRA